MSSAENFTQSAKPLIYAHNLGAVKVFLSILIWLWQIQLLNAVVNQNIQTAFS